MSQIVPDFPPSVPVLTMAVDGKLAFTVLKTQTTVTLSGSFVTINARYIWGPFCFILHFVVEGGVRL